MWFILYCLYPVCTMTKTIDVKNNVSTLLPGYENERIITKIDILKCLVIIYVKEWQNFYFHIELCRKIFILKYCDHIQYSDQFFWDITTYIYCIFNDGSTTMILFFMWHNNKSSVGVLFSQEDISSIFVN